MKNTKIVSAALLASALLGTGCSNVGNENPISPEQMVEIRNKQMSDQANSKPTDTSSPGGSATGGRPAGR